jgi:hypothetical protein
MRGGPDLDIQDPPVVVAPAPEPATGFPEKYSVPVEMALYQANATGLMFLRRWRGLGARFSPVAKVWRVGERLVAQIDFAHPVGPENQTGLVIQLTTHLWESLGDGHA